MSDYDDYVRCFRENDVEFSAAVKIGDSPDLHGHPPGTRKIIKVNDGFYYFDDNGRISGSSHRWLEAV